MPYEGHEDYSASKASADETVAKAPADAADYDPSDFTAQPGAAARAKGYPRHDGQSTTVGGPR
jgi:hypothetical protein